MNLKKLDGTFNITVNGMPYNTIEGDKYFKDTLSLFKSNPELFEIEVPVVTPPKTLEELKAEKIAELKSNCSNYILSVYPIYKQLNIINPLGDYSDEDRLTMNTFIDSQRTICASKEEEIKNATLKNINNISITFDKIKY